MLDAQHQRIVDSYIAARTLVWGADGVLRRQDDSDWAQGALYDVVWEHPRLGWSLIREISRRTQTAEILDDLANGPLHQLLVAHPQIVTDIESDATADTGVRALLSHFYEDNALPEELRARVLLAREPRH
jgi:hypothetical protein